MHEELHIAITIDSKKLAHLSGRHTNMIKHFIRGIEEASVYTERYLPKILPAVIELGILEYGQNN